MTEKKGPFLEPTVYVYFNIYTYMLVQREKNLYFDMNTSANEYEFGILFFISCNRALHLIQTSSPCNIMAKGFPFLYLAFGFS